MIVVTLVTSHLMAVCTIYIDEATKRCPSLQQKLGTEIIFFNEIWQSFQEFSVD